MNLGHPVQVAHILSALPVSIVSITSFNNTPLCFLLAGIHFAPSHVVKQAGWACSCATVDDPFAILFYLFVRTCYMLGYFLAFLA